MQFVEVKAEDSIFQKRHGAVKVRFIHHRWAWLCLNYIKQKKRKSLKSLKNFVITEDEINDEFLIGPVLRVNQKSVKIHYFDGTGKWEKPQNLRYEDITSVTFNSNYIRMHQKYIKK